MLPNDDNFSSSSAPVSARTHWRLRHKDQKFTCFSENDLIDITYTNSFNESRDFHVHRPTLLFFTWHNAQHLFLYVQSFLPLGQQYLCRRYLNTMIRRTIHLVQPFLTAADIISLQRMAPQWHPHYNDIPLSTPLPVFISTPPWIWQRPLERLHPIHGSCSTFPISHGLALP